MFRKADDTGYLPVLDKILRKTLVYGDKSLLIEIRLEEGACLPRHQHPHEQTGYLVAGRLELTIGATVQVAEPGDSWCIAGGVEHQARAQADCIAIEAFAPLREDYLPQE